MKATINIECTPEEARRFMGLPDLTSFHEAYLEKIRATIEQGTSPDLLRTMMQGWSPMGDAGVAFWKQIIDQLGSAQRPSNP